MKKLITLVAIATVMMPQLALANGAQRINRLERAVYDLQQRVDYLERTSAGAGALWTCQVKGFNLEYFGTGRSKGEAMASAIENCQSKDISSGFYCSSTTHTSCTSE